MRVCVTAALHANGRGEIIYIGEDQGHHCYLGIGDRSAWIAKLRRSALAFTFLRQTAEAMWANSLSTQEIMDLALERSIRSAFRSWKNSEIFELFWKRRRGLRGGPGMEVRFPCNGIGEEQVEVWEEESLNKHTNVKIDKERGSLFEIT
jgi:hypothetical protein